MEQTPSEKFITLICSLYADSYDDRIENTAPPTAGDSPRPAGPDWEPGMQANHRSLAEFQKELSDEHGIRVSTSKLRKILITGGCWSTARSREVAALYEQYHSIPRVAEALGVSPELVTMYLPYGKGVYDLEEKSEGAKRTAKWRARHHSHTTTMATRLSSDQPQQTEEE